MKRGPVLDRRSGDLDFYRRIPPDPVALSRESDSYLRCPIKERHSPQVERIDSATGKSLQTLQHQRALTAGGPSRAKVVSNFSEVFVRITSALYFCCTNSTFAYVSGNSRPVSAKSNGTFPSAFLTTSGVTRLSFPGVRDRRLEGIRGGNVFYEPDRFFLPSCIITSAFARTASCHVAFTGTICEGTFLRLRTSCPF